MCLQVSSWTTLHWIFLRQGSHCTWRSLISTAWLSGSMWPFPVSAGGCHSAWVFTWVLGSHAASTWAAEHLLSLSPKIDFIHLYMCAVYVCGMYVFMWWTHMCTVMWRQDSCYVTLHFKAISHWIQNLTALSVYRARMAWWAPVSAHLGVSGRPLLCLAFSTCRDCKWGTLVLIFVWQASVGPPLKTRNLCVCVCACKGLFAAHVHKCSQRVEGIKWSGTGVIGSWELGDQIQVFFKSNILSTVETLLSPLGWYLSSSQVL